MDFDYPIPPFKFSDEQFLMEDLDMFLDYVDYRVKGAFSSLAFRAVYGKENGEGTQAHERIINLEHTRLYRNTFKARLESSNINELWNTKLSINRLLAMIESPYTKDATRLQATKELNVLIGITVVDENGKTKAGASLNDFYKDHGIDPEKKAEEPSTIAGGNKVLIAPWQD